jgi:hypothetical protein
MKTTSSVLGQFDLCNDQAVFPSLDNGYYCPIDVRMHLFADADRWAWIVELVGYNPRGLNVIDVMHVFGDCLTRGEPGFENEDFLDRIDNFDDIHDEGDSDNSRGGVPVVVRGVPIPDTLPGGTPLVDVFRSLVPEHRDLLLADETELRARIPADLPRVLVLDEWRQPLDLWDDNEPSDYELYRQIADVLVSGDPARYQPDGPPTTHWSNWPDAGTL